MFLLVAGAICTLQPHCSEGMTVPLEGEGGASLGKYSPSDVLLAAKYWDQVLIKESVAPHCFSRFTSKICSFSAQDSLQGNPQTLGP